jgi:pilus assembly protein TadC
MDLNLLIFILVAAGVYLLLTAVLRGVYRPAELALRRRAPKRLSHFEAAAQTLAARLCPMLDIEPVKRLRLQERLRSLGYRESPELFQAAALARALLLASACLALLPLSPPFALALTATACLLLYRSQGNRLSRLMSEKRRRIERELPRFASTLRQCLNSTHDVVAILETYRKVCSPALRKELDRTLNDILTGNTERALRAMEGRVASAKLGQIVSGLIAVHRGDDQRLYFDMLAAEFRKAQNEEVAKTLLKRPAQLNPYMALLFLAMVLMIAAGLGTYIAQQFSTLFA